MLNLNKKKIVFLVTCVISATVFLSAIPVLRNPTLNILNTPLYLITIIQREISGVIFYHRNYIQNDRLRKEVDFLRNKVSLIEELQHENKRLGNLLSYKSKSPYKLIAARVIGRSLDNWSSSVIIDKGSNNGIRKDMVVINYLGLVGKISESTVFSSRVILINDPNMGVSALLQRSRQEGLISGTLGASLVMKYLPDDADIKVGDVVITSGLTKNYPKGIIIGNVAKIGKGFFGFGLYALVKPSVELGNIEEVLVIVE